MRPDNLSAREIGVKMVIFFLFAIMGASLACDDAIAQEALGLHPTGRSDYQSLPFPKEKPPIPPAAPGPPLPETPAAKEGQQKDLHRVFVTRIEVSGNTVFSDAEVAKVTAPYENRELTSEDLEELRRALTLHYIKAGYVNSGATIPDQTVVDGVVGIRIIEGKLTNVDIADNRWFRDGYYEDRLALGSGPPLNVRELQERMRILQQVDSIERLHAELRPGVKPGESELKLQVVESLPFRVFMGFDNYQSPTVGAERVFTTIVDQSLTGHGDALNFTYYGNFSGIDPQFDAWYVFPFTARDTTLTLRYRKNDFDVIEEPFDPLDIESKSDVYEITLRHPFYRSLNQEFALALTGEHLNSETFLLGEPFSFSPGTVDGESTVSALRFTQEWLYRTQTQVIAARSRFSLGLDVLGATTHESSSVPDGRFFSWLGQFQWARIFGSMGIQGIFRTDIQVANDPLLPLEQIPVGGRYSVRGYRENQLVRDNGFIASLESRIPLIRNKAWADYLQLAPFVDVGTAWNTDFPTPSPRTIASVGLGLRWAATLLEHPIPVKPQFEIYWGYPLEEIDAEGDDLQDIGIHLQFLVAAF